MKCFLLEDDTGLGQLISDELKNNGFKVTWVKNINEGREKIAIESFELAILDLYLPDGKGFELVPDINCPVIMMSALGDPENRLLGAELGVVDFIPKPFLLKELFIKVERALGSKTQEAKVWSYNEVLVDLNKRQVVTPTETHLLNKRDFRLLEVLTKRYPDVVTRDEIIDYVYGQDQNPSHRTIDNAVVGIRQMLCDDDHEWIRSVRGEGYQWQRERKNNG